MTAVRLCLKQAQSGPQGRALVRMPIDKMTEMGLRAGDTIAIRGARQSHARVMPAARGGEEVEASGALAQNIGAKWGDSTEVVPAALPPLRSVIIKATGATIGAPSDIEEALFDLPLTEGDVIELILPMGRTAQFEVMSLDPSPAGLFTDQTALTLAGNPKADATYDDIGGLSEEIARVHEMVAVPLLRPELFDRLCVPAPRGVLFTGPPGSGKTLLARSIAAKTSAAFFQINGPEIVSKHYGESEAALRNVFAAAGKDAPAIIFIDEIDAIAPRRDSLSGEKQVERRVVAQLLTLMDGLAERGRVIIMAATNLPDSLDPALRRPGRFDREIRFGPPKAAARREILDIHLRGAPLAEDVDLGAIAGQAHGYVGADLAALAREASLAALDRTVSEAGGEHAVRPENLFITRRDLEHGLAVTSPSALRDTLVESPTLTFDDIGGMEETKDALKEAVIWPFQHRETFEALNMRSVSGVLMSGPPGSGKTMLARALAAESGMNFIPVRPARIMSQFMGEAERAIAEIFAKARQSAPCLIFFDELDALAPRRNGNDATLDRIVAQLLTDLDGMAQNTDVVVLAATNRVSAIDPALSRPGRFDVVIRIPLPDMAARLAILEVHTKALPLDADVDLTQLAQQATDMSGADLAAMALAATRSAARRHLLSKTDEISVNRQDFEAALHMIRHSIDIRADDFITSGEAT